MSGDVLEASNLLVLGQQVEQRVEDYVDQAIGAGDRNVGGDREVLQGGNVGDGSLS